MSSNKDLNINQGSTFSFELQYLTRNSNGTETPVDITGCSVEMQFRQNERSATVLFDAVTENCISISDASQGKILLNIPEIVSKNFNFTRAMYDIELHYPDGFVERLMQGAVNISSEVSR